MLEVVEVSKHQVGLITLFLRNALRLYLWSIADSKIAFVAIIVPLLGLRTAITYVEHGRLELPTSTLPVLRSSQMS